MFRFLSKRREFDRSLLFPYWSDWTNNKFCRIWLAVWTNVFIHVHRELTGYWGFMTRTGREHRKWFTELVMFQFSWTSANHERSPDSASSCYLKLSIKSYRVHRAGAEVKRSVVPSAQAWWWWGSEEPWCQGCWCSPVAPGVEPARGTCRVTCSRGRKSESAFSSAVVTDWKWAGLS